MLHSFSNTVAKIYASALDRSRWTEALGAIEEITGSVGAVIGFVPTDARAIPFNIAGRFTDEQCATYSRDYQSICRRTRFMIEHPDLPIVYDSHVLSEREMDTDPVYDWFRKHGLRYFAGTALRATRSYQPVWTIQRSPFQGHVEPYEIELFREITPHLAQAIILADHLGTLRTYERFSSVVLETLPAALFALTESKQIAFANGKAQALLQAGDGLGSRSSQLEAALPEEQSVLERLIGEAATGVVARGVWTRISRTSGGPPYAVFVLPLTVPDDELSSSGAKVLVVVHDPGERHAASMEMLVCIFGLTDAEARVATALSSGHSLESAAACFGMRIATARTHLKAVFRKLGVNRQQDLIRVLCSMSAQQFGLPVTDRSGA